jgi:hypothetical protein
MKKIYNKFLIISTIALLVGGVYLYFSGELKSTEIVPVAFGSSLVSSNIFTSSATDVSQSEKISSDISFLTTLVSLKRIKIDTSLFTRKVFNQLQSNEVKIEKVTAGRVNPFAPIGASISTIGSPSSSSSRVVTDPATQITDVSVVLNGTVNVTTGVTDTYFEYGNTEDLGTSTDTVKQSLVGTFIKSISGLNSGTNYFYRACARINNVVSCGSTVSFTTN